MGNKIRGEVSINIDGKVWVLVLDFNAMCLFEERSGMVPTEFIAAFEEGRDVSFVALRHFAHALLLSRQPDATVQDAGNILSHDMGALTQTLSAAFPDPDPGASNPEGKTQAAAG